MLHGNKAFHIKQAPMFINAFLPVPMFLFALLFGSFGHVSVGSLESHIYTDNRTDVWVGVSAYNVYDPMVSIEGA